MYYSNSSNYSNESERRCECRQNGNSNCCSINNSSCRRNSSNCSNCSNCCNCSNCSNCCCHNKDCCTNPSVTVGSTTTGAPGTVASVTNSGTDCNAVLNFTIPAGQNGANGTPATVTVGSTTTGAPGTAATVTNSGTAQNAVLNFTIPAGANGTNGTNGTPATVTVGTTTTGAPGTNASVTNSGTAQNAVLNFTIPAGENGKDGAAATVTVGSTTTGAPGTNASVTNSGTPQNAVLKFTIPAGKNGTDGTDGADGTPATVSIGTTTTGTPGTKAFVTNTGTNQDAVFNFTIPAGKDGKDGKDGTNGLAAYGGLYHSKSQTAKPASSGTYQQLQLDSIMPLSNITTGLNNMMVNIGGNYEISYSIGIASKGTSDTKTTSTNMTFTTAIRKNGVAIPQTVCTASISPSQSKQNYYNTSYVTLASNDVLDLVFKVDDNTNAGNLTIYPNADCSLTIKRLS